MDKLYAVKTHLLRLIAGGVTLGILATCGWVLATNPTIADLFKLIILSLCALAVIYAVGTAVVWLLNDWTGIRP